jgi:hypothetical protein
MALAEECRALKMIADSRDGVTEAVLATHGLAGGLLAGLVGDRLATVTSETVWAEGQPIEVLQVRISDAGRRALHSLHVVRPVTWDIYQARHAPAKLLGTVEAVDVDAAIAETAKQFDVNDSRKLIGARRR